MLKDGGEKAKQSRRIKTRRRTLKQRAKLGNVIPCSEEENDQCLKPSWQHWDLFVDLLMRGDAEQLKGRVRSATAN